MPENGRQMTRGHLNDLTSGLAQQMFFWGRDVLSDGNLLLGQGFEKRPSTGLQGTSCYACRWQQGLIELHGACAGWYPENTETPGFLFIRHDRRCYLHRQSTPVVPGRYDYGLLKSGNVQELLSAARCFAAWLVEYETAILKQAGPAHREGCYRMFSKLPTSRPWLPPEKALSWLRQFAEASPGLERVRSLR